MMFHTNLVIRLVTWKRSDLSYIRVIAAILCYGKKLEKKTTPQSHLYTVPKGPMMLQLYRYKIQCFEGFSYMIYLLSFYSRSLGILEKVFTLTMSRLYIWGYQAHPIGPMRDVDFMIMIAFLCIQQVRGTNQCFKCQCAKNRISNRKQKYSLSNRIYIPSVEFVDVVTYL